MTLSRVMWLLIMTGRDINTLMEAIGYAFQDEGLLKQALTHGSWTNEHPDDPSYERLEFIGDAALGFVVALELFRRFPDWDEGQLTAAKSHLVDQSSLAALAAGVDLPAFLRLGTGERRNQAGPPASLAADAFEALVGAALLDGGLEAVRRVVLPRVAAEIDAMAREGSAPCDSKSRLQELVLRAYGKLPGYKLERQTGPDHERAYVYSVSTPDGMSALGAGASKKEAQKEAAAALLQLLERGRKPGL